MNNILTEAVQSLVDTLRNDLSEPIVYERGSQRVKILAIASKPEYEIESGPGEIQIVYDGLDWKFAAEDLIIDGKIMEPEPGDRIVRLQHRPNEPEIYQVMQLGSQQCWQRLDPLGCLILVNTKRVT